MKTRFGLLVGLLLIAAHATMRSQEPPARTDDSRLKVTLLGTISGPVANAQRLGISTLVTAGPETLLFDCGRSLMTGLARLAINPAGVTKVFLTHLHSDHVAGLPELYLFPWASSGRSVPLQVWGPRGTRDMVGHLQKAFAFDIRIRRDVDEKFPADGIKANVTDIHEGVVYSASEVKVTAFLVDHSPVDPAFGYRIDYRGHSAVLSGDTKPSDNLVKFSQGADLLIHEVGRWKQDPVFIGPPDEVVPGTRTTRRQGRIIADHHTDGAEAGRIFERVQPKLAVFSHYNVDPAATLPLVRQAYAGPVQFGEDLMTIEIGERVTVTRFTPPGR